MKYHRLFFLSPSGFLLFVFFLPLFFTATASFAEEAAQQAETIVRLGEVGTAGGQLDGLKPLYIDPNWDQKSGLHLVGSDSCWLQCAADATAADATDNPDASVGSEGRPMVFLGKTQYREAHARDAQHPEVVEVEVYSYVFIYVDGHIYFIGDATFTDIYRDGMVYPDEAYYLDTLEPIVLTGDMAGFPVRYNAAPVFRVAPAFEPLLIDVSREQLWDTGRIIIPTGAFDANGDQLSFSVYQYTDDGSQYRPSDDYYQQSRNQNIFTLDSPLPAGEWPVMLRDLSYAFDDMIIAIVTRKANPSAEVTEPMYLVQLLKDLHIIQARFNNGDNDNHDVSELSQLFSINDDYQLVVRQGADAMFPRTPYGEAYTKLAVVASDGYNQTVQPFKIRITTQHYYDADGHALSDPFHYFFREYLIQAGGNSLSEIALRAAANPEDIDIGFFVDAMYGGVDIDDTVQDGIRRGILKHLLLSSADGDEGNYHDYFADPDSPLWYNGRVFKRLARPGLGVGSHFPDPGAHFMTVGKLIDTVSAEIAAIDGLAAGQYRSTIRRLLVYHYLSLLDPVIARTVFTEPLTVHHSALPELQDSSRLMLERVMESPSSEAPEEQNTEWDLYQTYYGDLAWAQLYIGLSLLNRDGEDVSEKSKQEVIDYLRSHFSNLGGRRPSTQQQADLIYPSILLADAHSIINTWRDPDLDPLEYGEVNSTIRYASFMEARYQDLLGRSSYFMNDGQDIQFPDASLGGIDDQLSLTREELDVANDYYQQTIQIANSLSNLAAQHAPPSNPPPSIVSVATQILRERGLNPYDSVHTWFPNNVQYITDTYLNLYLSLYYQREEITIKKCRPLQAFIMSRSITRVRDYCHITQRIELPDPWPAYSANFDRWAGEEAIRLSKLTIKNTLNHAIGNPYVPAWSGKSVLHAHVMERLHSRLQEEGGSVVMPADYHDPLYTAILSTRTPDRVLLLFGTAEDLMATMILSRKDADDDDDIVSAISISTGYDYNFCTVSTLMVPEQAFMLPSGWQGREGYGWLSTREQIMLFPIPGDAWLWDYSTVCFNAMRQYWKDNISQRLTTVGGTSDLPAAGTLDFPALYDADSDSAYAYYRSNWALLHPDLNNSTHAIPVALSISDALMLHELSYSNLVSSLFLHEHSSSNPASSLFLQPLSYHGSDTLEDILETISDQQHLPVFVVNALHPFYLNHLSAYKEAELADKTTAERMRDTLVHFRSFPILWIFYWSAAAESARTGSGADLQDVAQEFARFQFGRLSVFGGIVNRAVEDAINRNWAQFAIDMVELGAVAVGAVVGAGEIAGVALSAAMEETVAVLGESAVSLSALDAAVTGDIEALATANVEAIAEVSEMGGAEVVDGMEGTLGDVNAEIAGRQVRLRQTDLDWQEVDLETDLTKPNGPTYVRNPNNPAQFIRVARIAEETTPEEILEGTTAQDIADILGANVEEVETGNFADILEAGEVEPTEPTEPTEGTEGTEGTEECTAAHGLWDGMIGFIFPLAYAAGPSCIVQSAERQVARARTWGQRIYKNVQRRLRTCCTRWARVTRQGYERLPNASTTGCSGCSVTRRTVTIGGVVAALTVIIPTATYGIYYALSSGDTDGVPTPTPAPAPPTLLDDDGRLPHYHIHASLAHDGIEVGDLISPPIIVTMMQDSNDQIISDPGLTYAFYTVSGGDLDSIFSIDSNTGALSLQSAVPGTYSMVITATSTNSLTGESLTIDILYYTVGVSYFLSGNTPPKLLLDACDTIVASGHEEVTSEYWEGVSSYCTKTIDAGTADAGTQEGAEGAILYGLILPAYAQGVSGAVKSPRNDAEEIIYVAVDGVLQMFREKLPYHNNYEEAVWLKASEQIEADLGSRLNISIITPAPENATIQLNEFPYVWQQNYAADSMYLVTEYIPGYYTPWIPFDSKVHGVAVRKRPDYSDPSDPSLGLSGILPLQFNDWQSLQVEIITEDGQQIQREVRTLSWQVPVRMDSIATDETDRLSGYEAKVPQVMRNWKLNKGEEGAANFQRNDQRSGINIAMIDEYRSGKMFSLLFDTDELLYLPNANMIEAFSHPTEGSTNSPFNGIPGPYASGDGYKVGINKESWKTPYPTTAQIENYQQDEHLNVQEQGDAYARANNCTAKAYSTYLREFAYVWDYIEQEYRNPGKGGCRVVEELFDGIGDNMSSDYNGLLPGGIPLPLPWLPNIQVSHSEGSVTRSNTTRIPIKTTRVPVFKDYGVHGHINSSIYAPINKPKRISVRGLLQIPPETGEDATAQDSSTLLPPGADYILMLSYEDFRGHVDRQFAYYRRDYQAREDSAADSPLVAYDQDVADGSWKWEHTFNIGGWGEYSLGLYYQASPERTPVLISGLELKEMSIRFVSVPGAINQMVQDPDSEEYHIQKATELPGINLKEEKGTGGYIHLNDYRYNTTYGQENNMMQKYNKHVLKYVREYTINQGDTITFAILDSDPHTINDYETEYYLSDRSNSMKLPTVSVPGSHLTHLAEEYRAANHPNDENKDYTYVASAQDYLDVVLYTLDENGSRRNSSPTGGESSSSQLLGPYEGYELDLHGRTVTVERLPLGNYDLTVFLGGIPFLHHKLHVVDYDSATKASILARSATDILSTALYDAIIGLSEGDSESDQIMIKSSVIGSIPDHSTLQESHILQVEKILSTYEYLDGPRNQRTVFGSHRFATKNNYADDYQWRVTRSVGGIGGIGSQEVDYIVSNNIMRASTIVGQNNLRRLYFPPYWLRHFSAKPYPPEFVDPEQVFTYDRAPTLDELTSRIRAGNIRTSLENQGQGRELADLPENERQAIEADAQTRAETRAQIVRDNLEGNRSTTKEAIDTILEDLLTNNYRSNDGDTPLIQNNDVYSGLYTSLYGDKAWEIRFPWIALTEDEDMIRTNIKVAVSLARLFSLVGQEARAQTTEADEVMRIADASEYMIDIGKKETTGGIDTDYADKIKAMLALYKELHSQRSLLILSDMLKTGAYNGGSLLDPEQLPMPGFGGTTSELYNGEVISVYATDDAQMARSPSLQGTNKIASCTLAFEHDDQGNLSSFSCE